MRTSVQMTRRGIAAVGEAHTHEMPSVGAVPNLYWTSITQERLRGDSKYTPLPAVHTLRISDSSSYR